MISITITKIIMHMFTMTRTIIKMKRRITIVTITARKIITKKMAIMIRVVTILKRTRMIKTMMIIRLIMTYIFEQFEDLLMMVIR